MPAGISSAKSQPFGIGTLASSGFDLVSDHDAADVVIVNTCGFLEASKQESIDVINEAVARKEAGTIDRVVVAILVNQEKAPLFDADERVEMAREVFKNQSGVEVDTFEGLLVDYVRRREANVIVRGLRAISDFEFELQMALMNRHLDSRIETVFMMPAEPYTYVSSRLIKEICALGGSVDGLVPPEVDTRLQAKQGVSSTLQAR